MACTLSIRKQAILASNRWVVILGSEQLASTAQWEKDLLTMARNFCPNVSMDRSGKHIKIYMFGPTGEKRTVFASSTPSDHRTLENTARQMRRVAVEVGAFR